MEPGEAISALKKAGLGIAFTEHVDFAESFQKDPLATDAPRGLEGMGDFVCDFKIYPKMYEKFRGEGVTLGLELGLTQAYLSENKKLAADDYDFIIGSIHTVDGIELYQACHGKLPKEPFAQQLKTAPTACISRYLSYAKEMIELYGFFDSFGHIDYIARYLPQLSQNFSYANFTAEFDALLKALAEREIALEINTCLLGKIDAGKTMLEICCRFAELGGRLCTIGSDAHKVSSLGRNFKDAKEIAETTGLMVVYYKERKPVRCG